MDDDLKFIFIDIVSSICRHISLFTGQVQLAGQLLLSVIVSQHPAPTTN